MNMHTTLSGVHTPALPIPTLESVAWQDSPAAIGIIAAIVDLSAIARRLEAVRIHNPQLHGLLDAETLVGRVDNRQALHHFGRGYETIAAPSNGTCAVASLWNLLADIRNDAITLQLKAEGLPSPYEAGLTQARADAAFDRRDELDHEAMSVAQAVCLALSCGRA